MPDKIQRTVVVAQSTITIIEMANEMVRIVTRNHAKRYQFATLDFYDPDFNVGQLVYVKGKVLLDTLGYLVEVNMVLNLVKQGEVWEPDQEKIATVYANKHEIVFRTVKGTYYSDHNRIAHEKLIAEWGLR